MTLRSLAKRLAERTLASTLGSTRRTRGRTLILAYHNVVPGHVAGQGDRSLHLPESDFREQLDLLEARCRVVALAEALEEPSDGPPRVAITFDDAYTGAVELALPELARRGLPATVFVAPGLLGTRSFWWDEIIWGGETQAAAVRQQALETFSGRAHAIRGTLSRWRRDGDLPEPYRCASEDQLLAAARLPGVTLGSHSWSHPNLARLDIGELEEELSLSLGWLAGSGASTLPVLAYPYGRTSPEVQEAARRAGYLAALRVEGGWVPGTDADLLALPRFNVPAGLSREGLLLRLAGVLAP